MNKLTIVASALALSFTLATPAFAQAAQGSTRAEVKAERDRAIKAGEVKLDGEGRSSNQAALKSDVARDTVKAERNRAIKAGEVKLDGEGRSPAQVKPKVVKSRADVKADRDAAIAAGTIDRDGEGRSKQIAKKP